jgi:ectoine hydroxylase-related dioxygenase (phytanoyl-CoA dioxygenase family)
MKTDAHQRLNAEYQKQGYCIAKNIFDEKQIDQYLVEINNILIYQLRRFNLKTNTHVDLKAIHQNLMTLFIYNQNVYLATVRLFSKLKGVYDLLLHDGIAQICNVLGIKATFFHTSPVFHIMSQQLKIDGGYFGFEAHQDWTAIQTSLNTITVWLALHDIDRGLYPLEVIPGSHLQGLCRGKPSENTYDIDPSEYSDQKFIPLEVNKGDVVFKSNFLIHRTGITDTQHLRLSLSWRYEDALEPTYPERNFPFAQHRNFNRGLIVDNFPTKAQVTEIYTKQHEKNHHDQIS